MALGLKMELVDGRLGAGQRGIRGFKIQLDRVGKWLGHRFVGGDKMTRYKKMAVAKNSGRDAHEEEHNSDSL